MTTSMSFDPLCDAVIGHHKTAGHVACNHLKGRDGNHANAVFTATVTTSAWSSNG